MATFAEAPKGNEKAGEKIFKTKCAQCHAVEQAAGHKQGIFYILLLPLMMRIKFQASCGFFSSVFCSLSSTRCDDHKSMSNLKRNFVADR